MSSILVNGLVHVTHAENLVMPRDSCFYTRYTRSIEVEQACDRIEHLLVANEFSDVGWYLPAQMVKQEVWGGGVGEEVYGRGDRFCILSGCR